MDISRSPAERRGSILARAREETARATGAARKDARRPVEDGCEKEREKKRGERRAALPPFNTWRGGAVLQEREPDLRGLPEHQAEDEKEHEAPSEA